MRKVREIPKPERGLRWFWDPVEASGLHHLIYTGFSSVTNAMVHALCERWHMEISSFHLPVGEMTITFDDVYNLLHLPIQGRMLDHDVVVDWDYGLTQMTRLLGMSGAAGRAEAKTEYGAHMR
uniref:IMP dehydrogenase/GMP reductase, related n=1 Tax=Medicago truncatula TaxID=3880 RepID=A2Q2H3_MEDTR|nr:IMP dehydrogenase/GMP reductase, related [Medicago truncatula]